MSLDRDAQEALNLHNEARDEIHEDPRPHLKWDPSLAADALRYAQKLASRNRDLKHSSNQERTKNGQLQGENLAMSTGSMDLVTASRMWIEEKWKYRGERVGCGRDSMWGHYTEIIWPECTKVGLASARSRSGATFVVARYDKCQLGGRTPYNSSLGNIFKNRTWQPIGGGSGGRGHGRVPSPERRVQNLEQQGRIREEGHRHGRGSGDRGRDTGAEQLRGIVEGLFNQMLNPQDQGQGREARRRRAGSRRLEVHAMGPGGLFKMLKELKDEHARRR